MVGRCGVLLDDKHARRDAADRELLVALDGGLFGLDVRNVRARWSAPQVCEKLLDGCRRALDMGDDGAVGAVGDPAEQAQFLRAAAGRVAEADPLDFAVDRRAEGG